MGNNYLDIFGPFSLPPQFLPSKSPLSVAEPFWIMFAVLSNAWRPSKVIRTGGFTSGSSCAWGSGWPCKDSTKVFLLEELLLLEAHAAAAAAVAGAATGSTSDCRNLGSSQMQKLLNVKNSHPSNLCFKIRNPSYFFRTSHIAWFHGTAFGVSSHFLVKAAGWLALAFRWLSVPCECKWYSVPCQKI